MLCQPTFDVLTTVLIPTSKQTHLGYALVTFSTAPEHEHAYTDNT